MNANERKAMIKKATQIKSKISDLLCEADIEVGLALTVLVAMAVQCALDQAQMEPQDFIHSVVGGVCKAIEAKQMEDMEDDEEGEENVKTYGRTTH